MIPLTYLFVVFLSFPEERINGSFYFLSIYIFVYSGNRDTLNSSFGLFLSFLRNVSAGLSLLLSLSLSCFLYRWIRYAGASEP